MNQTQLNFIQLKLTQLNLTQLNGFYIEVTQPCYFYFWLICFLEDVTYTLGFHIMFYSMAILKGVKKRNTVLCW